MKGLIYLFLERRKEGEKHQCGRETLISCLSHIPCLGMESTTQALALTGNPTGDLEDAQPMSHTHQGLLFALNLTQGCVLILEREEGGEREGERNINVTEN